MVIDSVFIENMNEFPCWIIGDARIDFLKNYNGPVVRLQGDNPDKDLEETIAYYTGMSNIGRILVIDGISFCKTANVKLLKFLEETKLQVVLLGVFDTMEPVIASRIRKIVKYNREKTKSSMLRTEDYYNMVSEDEEKEMHIFNQYKRMGEISPMVYKEQKRANKRMKSVLRRFV